MRRIACCLVLLLIGGVATGGASQNSVQNANFDKNRSIWVLSSDPADFGVTVTWQPVDGIGSSHSGSLLAVGSLSTTSTYEIITQCVTIVASAEPTYALSLRTRHRNIPSQTVLAAASFRAGPNCTGASLGSFELATTTAANNAWQTEFAVHALPGGAQSALVSLEGAETARVATRLELDDVYFGPAAPSTCGAGGLCLNDAPGDHRFRVVGTFATTQGSGSSGTLQPLDLTGLGVARGGLMWFFSLDDPEMLVKVLNGCGITDRFWVFIAAGTNVGVEVFVEDTHTGEVVIFHNPDLGPFPAVQDTFALACH